MSPDTLIRIAQVFRTTPSALVYGDSPPPLVRVEGRTLGDRLRALRLVRGLGVRELARAIGEERSASARISAYETGRNVPLVKSLVKLCNALQADVESVLLPPD